MTWARAPSPCVGVCKFRDEGRCVGCAMTVPEKKAARRMRGKSEKRPFLRALVATLRSRGRLDYWSRMYRRKCERKGVDCPLDKMDRPPAA